MKTSEVINFLIDRRIKAGLSQSAVAKKIGCSQSKVSKIECSEDEYAQIKDLQLYAKALGLEIKIEFAREKC